MELFKLFGIIDINTAKALEDLGVIIDKGKQLGNVLNDVENKGKKAGEETSNSMNKLGSNIDSVSKKGNGLANVLGTVAKRGLEIATAIGLYKSFAEVIGYLKSVIIGYNSQIEQSNITFTTLLGNAEKAKGYLEELKDFAAKTPFEFPDLLQATVRMKAMGFATEELIPTLKAVGDASAGLGMGKEGIDRIILALSQMKAKSKVSAEEMRQLAETGIPAWEILAEKTGKSTAELMEFTRKGIIPADFAVRALIEGMQERFPGMMKNLENSWTGIISTIRDNARFILGDLTKPLFESLKSVLKKVKDFSLEFYSVFREQGLASAIKQFIPSNITEMISPIFESLKSYWASLKEVVSEFGSFIQSTFQNLAPFFGTVIKLLIDFGTIVNQVITSVLQILQQLGPVTTTVIVALLALKPTIAIVEGLGKAWYFLSGAQGVADLLANKTTTLAVAMFRLVDAPNILKGLSAAFGVLKTAMLSNPVTLWVAGITTAIGVTYSIVNAIKEHKEQQEKLNATMLDTYRIKQQGISLNEAEKVKQEIDALKQLTAEYQKYKLIIEKNKPEYVETSGGGYRVVGNKDYQDAQKRIQEIKKEMAEWGVTIDTINGRLETLQEAYDRVMRLKRIHDLSDLETEKQKADEVLRSIQYIEEQVSLYQELSSKKQLNASQSQQLAQVTKFLTETFGENVFIRNEEGKIIKLNLDLIGKEISGRKAQAQALIDTVRTNMEARKQDIESEKERVTKILEYATNELETYQKLIKSKEYLGYEQVVAPMKYASVSNYVEQLKAELAGLNKEEVNINRLISNLGKLEVPSKDNNNVFQNDSKNKTTKYQNDKLEQALRLYEHKKRLDKLSYEEEIKLLESIKAKYVKTAEERMDLDERIYEVKKRYTEQINKLWEDEANGITKLFNEVARNMGSNSETAKIEIQGMLNELIAIAQKLNNVPLLNSLQESAKLVESAITDASGKSAQALITNLLKASSIVSSRLSADSYNTANAMANAYSSASAIIAQNLANIRAQMREKVKDTADNIFDALTEAVKKSMEASSTISGSFSDAGSSISNTARETAKAQIKEIERVRDAQLKALQEQLDALDEAQEQEEAQAELYKHIAKVRELEVAIEEANTEKEKFKLLEELSKENSDYAMSVKKREINKKKEAIRDEMQRVREKAQAEIDAIREVESASISSYGSMYSVASTTYDDIEAKAKETAKTLLLDLENNLDTVVELLFKYSEFGGQSFGDGFLNGFKDRKELIKQQLLELLNLIKGLKEFESINLNSSPTTNNNENKQYGNEVYGYADTVSPGLMYKGWALMQEYHTGGIVGKEPNKEYTPDKLFDLAPNEVLAILEIGEMVIPKEKVNKYKNSLTFTFESFINKLREGVSELNLNTLSDRLMSPQLAFNINGITPNIVTQINPVVVPPTVVTTRQGININFYNSHFNDGTDVGRKILNIMKSHGIS